MIEHPDCKEQMMSSYTVTKRLMVLVCCAVFSLGPGVGFSMDGSTSETGTLTEKLKVKGCGSERWRGEFTGFSMSDNV